MVSDDTEHACMVAQSLVESGDDVEKLFDGSLLGGYEGGFFVCRPGPAWPPPKACIQALLGSVPEP